MQLNASSLAILSQLVSMRFNMGLARPVTSHEFMAMEVPSAAGENLYPYFKEIGYIREWIGDREIQNLDKGDFKIPNKTFEQTHGIDRERVADDSFGFYGNVFEQTGQNVRSFPAEKCFGLLTAGFTTLGLDGQYFFDTDHPVGAGVVSNHMGGSSEPWYIVDASKVFKPIIWQPRQAFDLVRMFNPTDTNVFFSKQFVWGIDGRAGVGFSPFWQLAFASKQTLDDAAVTAALTAMSVQRNDIGKPIGAIGTHFVCSPTIGETARRLFTNARLANGADNPLLGRLQVVVAPELL